MCRSRDPAGSRWCHHHPLQGKHQIATDMLKCAYHVIISVFVCVCVVCDCLRDLGIVGMPPLYIRYICSIELITGSKSDMGFDPTIHPWPAPPKASCELRTIIQALTVGYGHSHHSHHSRRIPPYPNADGALLPGIFVSILQLVLLPRHGQSGGRKDTEGVVHIGHAILLVRYIDGDRPNWSIIFRCWILPPWYTICHTLIPTRCSLLKPEMIPWVLMSVREFSTLESASSICKARSRNLSEGLQWDWLLDVAACLRSPTLV